MKTNILENHKNEIVGMISVNDRIIIRGNLPGVSYIDGMTSYLYSNKIRIFDYTEFASGLRDEYNNYVTNW